MYTNKLKNTHFICQYRTKIDVENGRFTKNSPENFVESEF